MRQKDRRAASPGEIRRARAQFHIFWSAYFATVIFFEKVWDLDLPSCIHWIDSW